ncbi:BaiN/RdsA family NAD(P)/FAD-dependent oxidoreductase [Humisphaera borealis]|uniref:Aminoacetone oxidase family FAD-binding enzyme n=1 Tax=Humisphaera borealis TaxID=2807512 RepID=A0A7M2WRP8_9BACT|nr:aminoacetone oxidase family FAD-binding enzyme [Humisphaera borealis]QOV88188.1 aminoacetone oxidase family FAD-binding enzyme [Humisphaera borealis]
MDDPANNTETADLAIVGGGAAGLAAAIFAAEAAPPGRRIIVLDGAKTLGAKILVAGGGRCNVTHHQVRPQDFNGSQNIVRNVMSAFDVAATIRWFSDMGVELRQEETGKLFPVANTARAVLSALLERCRALNVVLQTSSRVTRIVAPDSAETTDATDRQFRIEHAQGVTYCSRVIVSTGGRSLPRSGSDGSGWDILRQMGHTVTPTYAALVPLVLDAKMFHATLAGVSQDVELTVTSGGKRIDRRTGSLLWTHIGISGPVVMDASRHWTVAKETGGEPTMKCNLLPGETFESIEQAMMKWTADRPRASMLTLLSTKLSERVAAAILAHVDVAPTTIASQLSRDARRTLAHAITGLVLPVAQHRGWNYAEVTAGGVPLNEIDYRTMESRKVPGLYLAGEVLDCDGRIGGFNFQWAWATGYLAGRAAASR